MATLIGNWQGRPVYRMCDNDHCLEREHLREMVRDGSNYWYCSPACFKAIIDQLESSEAAPEDECSECGAGFGTFTGRNDVCISCAE